MGVSKVLSIEDLERYNIWCDEDLVSSWIKCAEYLIYKYNATEFVIRHKKLSDGQEEEFQVGIKTRNVDTSKIENTIQKNRTIEDAGIAMGLLTTLWLRPPRSFRVLMQGDGYDYCYLPEDSQEEELIEVTGTEKAGEGDTRLKSKIKKFNIKHPESSGYISVSCFYDKLQIHWGHKN